VTATLRKDKGCRRIINVDSSSDDDDVIEAVISKNTGQDSGNQHFSKSLNDRDRLCWTRINVKV